MGAGAAREPRGKGPGCCCAPGVPVLAGQPGLCAGAGWVAGGSQERGGCAHGWGMWVYAGREGRALPLQRGACSCLPLPVGAAPAAAGPAAAFPEKQLRLSAWLASSPLTWLLHETGRSSLWIHLWDTLLRLLWGVAWGAWGPCSSDQPAHTGPLLVAGISVCHRGLCWRQRLGDDLSRLPPALWLLVESLVLQSSHQV